MSMSFDVEPSVQALRAEAETNRARLRGTVQELRTQVADTTTDLKERLSPSAIKAEVKDYVRDSRDQLWHSLQHKARDNPLQAVAVGAALAFPAFKLLRAMPAPLLLVGAGLLLSRTTGDQTAILSQASDGARERVRGALDSATDAISEGTDTARRKLHDAQDYVREGVDTVMEQAPAAASSIKERVTSAADEAKSAISGFADKMAGQGEGLAQQARAAVSNSWEQNPLIVAGAGLLLGAFIAAAFPSTQAEETLFGDASGALRRQAEGVAAKGVEAARTAVESAAGAASEQGLSVDGLTSLGESLTDKVRAVAERGVEAALGENKPANT
jgi:ElaB/YqjD/DUF883 family membrane-anchored ribosome-binding protein